MENIQYEKQSDTEMKKIIQKSPEVEVISRIALQEQYNAALTMSETWSTEVTKISKELAEMDRLGIVESVIPETPNEDPA